MTKKSNSTKGFPYNLRLNSETTRKMAAINTNKTLQEQK